MKLPGAGCISPMTRGSVGPRRGDFVRAGISVDRDGRRRRSHQRASPGGAGRGLAKCRSIGALARPRPEQRVTLASLVIEEIGVDRRVERGVVELEREVVATFLRALRPCCPDFGSAHVHAVARSIVVGAIGFGDDADAFGLHAQGDDLALEIILGQLATVFLK